MLSPRSLGAVSPVLSTFPNSHKDKQVKFKLSCIKGQNVLPSRNLITIVILAVECSIQYQPFAVKCLLVTPKLAS